MKFAKKKNLKQKIIIVKIFVLFVCCGLYIFFSLSIYINKVNIINSVPSSMHYLPKNMTVSSKFNRKWTSHFNKRIYHRFKWLGTEYFVAVGVLGLSRCTT